MGISVFRLPLSHYVQRVAEQKLFHPETNPWWCRLGQGGAETRKLSASPIGSPRLSADTVQTKRLAAKPEFNKTARPLPQNLIKRLRRLATISDLITLPAAPA